MWLLVFVGFLLALGLFVLVAALCPAAQWIYAELKGWQEGVGATFALFAILIGALLNARLNRGRDVLRRRDEAKAYAAALSAEVEEIGRQLGELIPKGKTAGATKKTVKTGPIVSPFLVDTAIYNSSPQAISMLTPDLSSRVVAFYSRFSAFRRGVVDVFPKDRTADLPENLEEQARNLASDLAPKASALAQDLRGIFGTSTLTSPPTRHTTPNGAENT